MDQNDWQFSRSQQNQRQKMPDTPPHQNVRRYSQQTLQSNLQQQMQNQHSQGSNTSQYSYTSPTRSTASPSNRHSITSDFGSINIRDDNHTTPKDKSTRPNLSLHPGNIRPMPQNHQGSVPSSPTKQSISYNTSNYSVTPTHPSVGRTTTDDMRLYGQPNSRHSSPMHTASPSVSPYYPTTPHILNPI